MCRQRRPSHGGMKQKASSYYSHFKNKLFAILRVEEIFFHFRGEEILVYERLGDVFRRENVTFYVKFRNLESMTKKGSSEILADGKTYFCRKITWKSVACEIILDSLKKFPKCV